MNPTTRRLLATPWLATILLALLLCRPTAAQCQNGWDVGAGALGTNHVIYVSTMWDPDGAGPLPPRVVVGGQFTTAGGIVANRIAQWDPATSTWSALGSGMDGYVLALAGMPNGDLIAGGGFATAGGTAARYIARWDGTAWSSLGPMSGPSSQALSGDVYTLTVLPSGELVAGGIFYFAGWVQVNFVARWDGSSWWPISAVGMNNYVLASALLPNGDLVAGGYFTSAGGVAANYIARWNGAGWSPMGAGANSSVFALLTGNNGDLVAGGQFTAMSGIPTNRIARWSPAGGGTWSAMGTGMNFEVRALAELPQGELVAGGQFSTAGGSPANFVARWNGSWWSAVGAGVGSDVRALTALPGGGFVAGGNLLEAGGVPALHFARACGGPTWAAHGSGCGGGNGPLVLTAVSPPQLGATFRLAVQNLSGGPTVMLLGLGYQNLPLQPYGFGFPCRLLATPDATQFLVTSGGTGSWSMAIPNAAAFAGLHLWNQAIEFGAIPAVSNGGDGEIR